MIYYITFICTYHLFIHMPPFYIYLLLLYVTLLHIYPLFIHILIHIILFDIYICLALFSHLDQEGGYNQYHRKGGVCLLMMPLAPLIIDIGLFYPFKSMLIFALKHLKIWTEG